MIRRSCDVDNDNAKLNAEVQLSPCSLMARSNSADQATFEAFFLTG
jgi:hypothetical protein